MKVRQILLTLLLCLGISATYFTRTTAAQGSPRHIDIVAKRFEYQPSELTLKKGEPVVITIKSADVSHGLHFKELNLQTTIEKGGSSDLSFTPTEAGDFVGHCSVFCGSGHGGMALTFHVTE
jgi:cytochrome c oxidase subunit 2